MALWRGLAVVGVGAVGVAVLAYGGTVLSVGPTRVADHQLLTIGELALFVAAAVLLGAALARGLSQLQRAVGLARRAE